MTGRQRALVFIVAGLCGILGVGAFGWIVWRTFESFTSATPVTAADRLLVVTADKLVPLGIDKPNRDAELLSAVRQFDGSMSIEYDYSSARDPAAEAYLSVSSSVLVFPNSLTAMQTYKMQEIAIRGGTRFAKLELKEMPRLLTLGDQRYSALMERDGEPHGNLFLIRQGRVVHICTISGLTIDEPEKAQIVFGPVLEATKRRFEKK